MTITEKLEARKAQYAMPSRSEQRSRNTALLISWAAGFLRGALAGCLAAGLILWILRL